MSIDPAEYAPVAFAESDFAAKTKAVLLQSEGIDAVVVPQHTEWSGLTPIMSDQRTRMVPVLVPRADVERARAILEQRMREARMSDDREGAAADTDDALPEAGDRPGRVQRMPLLARIGWLIAALLVLLTVAGWLLMTLW